jgi:hypothetical protein
VKQDDVVAEARDAVLGVDDELLAGRGLGLDEALPVASRLAVQAFAGDDDAMNVSSPRATMRTNTLRSQFGSRILSPGLKLNSVMMLLLSVCVPRSW